jgi:hypothetical protein
MMKTLALGAVAALFAFSSTASADCLDVATKAIEQKGFTVRSTSTMEELAEPQQGSTTGYRAWLRVASCETGYIIVNMRATCDIKGVWAQGSCDVPEIRQALRDQN